MKIFIGSDHAGFKLKEEIKKYLSALGLKFQDLGAKSLNLKDDYPHFAKKVAKKVAKNLNNKGIMICGTGLGSCIVANKVKRIRAISAWDAKTARQSREHLNANVLCLGGRIQRVQEAKKIVKVWLETKFSRAKRHIRRIKKISRIEKNDRSYSSDNC